VVSLISTGVHGVFVNKDAGTGKAVTISGFTLGGPDADKYLVEQPTALANITRADLSISGITANTKVYNGTTTATINAGSASLVTVFSGDVVSLISTGVVANFASKNVGPGIQVTTSGFTLTGGDAANYNLIQPVLTGNIIRASLTVTGLAANNKIYDGTLVATLNTGATLLSGVIGTDAVLLNISGASGSFASKTVGTSKAVTAAGLSLGGTDAGNYSVTQPVTTANIAVANLTVAGETGNSRVYNGTTSASLNNTNATLTGLISGDVVTLVSTSATGIFANKNAGTGKPIVTAGYTIAGTDAINYSVTQPVTTGNITKAVLTVTGITANNKVYDGTTTATFTTTGASFTGVFAGDVVTLNSSNASGAFSGRNTGTSIPVSAYGFATGGTDGDNYILTQPALSANITKRPLKVTAQDLLKHYNSEYIFTGKEFTTEGLIEGDPNPVVTLSSPGASLTALIGKYIISATGSGTDNYVITYIPGTLTVGKSVLLATADSKTRVYGSDNPDFSITYSGFFKNEDASSLDIAPVASTAAVKTSEVGTYPIVLSGGSDNNYDLVLTDGSLEITKAPLIITADNRTRTYGDPNPELTLNFSGFIDGQDQNALNIVPFVGTTAGLESDAGDYEITVSWAEATNYSITYVNGTLHINKADQAITFDDLNTGLKVNQDYNLNATASSGLVVKFEISDPEIADLNGNVLTIKKDGDLTLRAYQEGNKNWNAAPDAIKSYTILPADNGISSLFTPNNDGMNDYWYIPDIEQYGKLKVTIFNRYGQTVYQSDSYKNDWEGTWNGFPLPSATYYYIINSSSKGFIKGVVNIVR
jgi:gliding motility-associated-like protein